MTKRYVILTVSVFLVGITVAIACLYTYYTNLHPRLVCVCSLKEANAKCPEFDKWIGSRKPWEWVPDELLVSIYAEPVSERERLFATYETKVVKFTPDSFHATKGTLDVERGDAKTIYIYAWDKRYSPMIGP